MKRILIIGASSGIGAAVARRLASRFAAASQDKHKEAKRTDGLELILHGRDEARLKAVAEEIAQLTTQKPKPTTLLGDVVAWAEDVKSIPAIEPVDRVVWCAGICELAAGQMLGLKALRRTLSVNLEAPLVVLSHFYRKGIIRDGGTIVLLGSQSAHDAGEGFSVYAASKGGLASAARVLGKEFSRRNVAVHCLEPGTVDTPMTRKLVQTFGGLREGNEETMLAASEVAEQVVALLFSSRFAKASCFADKSQDKRKAAPSMDSGQGKSQSG